MPQDLGGGAPTDGTGSSGPVHVAALLRRGPVIGLWSTLTATMPAAAAAPSSDPWTSELSPEPETPVGTVSACLGGLHVDAALAGCAGRREPVQDDPHRRPSTGGGGGRQ